MNCDLTTDTVTTTNATTDTAEPTARRRKPFKVGPMVEPVATPAGADTYYVALSGTHGAGLHMTVDRDDWEHARRTWGGRWIIHAVGGCRYVASGRRQATASVKQNASCPLAYLARLLMAAKPGETVIFRNGDTLDLRRSNLAVLDEAAAAALKHKRIVARAEAAKAAKAARAAA